MVGGSVSKLRSWSADPGLQKVLLLPHCSNQSVAIVWGTFTTVQPMVSFWKLWPLLIFFKK